MEKLISHFAFLSKADARSIGVLSAAIAGALFLLLVLPEILFWLRMRRLEAELVRMHQSLHKMETRLARLMAQNAISNPAGREYRPDLKELGSLERGSH